MIDTKRMVSFRLTRESRELLDALARNLGINRTATIEVLLRRVAEDEGLREALELQREERKETAA